MLIKQQPQALRTKTFPSDNPKCKQSFKVEALKDLKIHRTLFAIVLGNQSCFNMQVKLRSQLAHKIDKLRSTKKFNNKT